MFLYIILVNKQNIKMSSIQISYYRHNPPTYVDRETGKDAPYLPKNGSPLQVVDLKQAWIAQTQMNPEAIKGSNGMIFPFSYKEFYPIEYIREECLTNNGVIFVDIDCGVDYINQIYNSIPECNNRLYNGILAAARTKKGLHFLFLSQPKTAEEFRVAVFYRLTALAWTIKEVTGIDLRNIDGALDACTFSIKQRLFLRYSKDVYWNDMAIPTEFDRNTLDTLRKEYKDLYNKALPATGRSLNSSLKRRCEGEVEEIFEVPIHPYLPHQGNPSRWTLFDSLCCCYGDNEEELMKQWDRCAELIEPGNGHNTDWFKAEPRKNKWFDIWLNNNSHWCNEDLLMEFGYKLKKMNKWYQPISGMPTNIDDLMGLDLSKVPSFTK